MSCVEGGVAVNVAIIPARGGSKRIPRKNIKDFAGKPILAWSIEAAIQSGCFERIIVSTDDKEIAAVAREYGAETPFIRPKELSDEYTGTTPVIRHALEWFDEKAIFFDYACCIYATAPFLGADDLFRGFECLVQQDCDYAFSVTTFPFPIQRAIRINENSRVEMFQKSFFNTRSQDLEEAYHDAGQFYWGKADAWKREVLLFDEGSVPVILERQRVQDIDTFEDWTRAEWLFKAMQAGL